VESPATPKRRDLITNKRLVREIKEGKEEERKERKGKKEEILAKTKKIKKKE
jgi:hypothetical protein